MYFYYMPFRARELYLQFLSLPQSEIKIFSWIISHQMKHRCYVVIIIIFSVLQRNVVLLILCKLQHPHADFILNALVSK